VKKNNANREGWNAKTATVREDTTITDVYSLYKVICPRRELKKSWTGGKGTAQGDNIKWKKKTGSPNITGRQLFPSIIEMKSGGVVRRDAKLYNIRWKKSP